MSCKNWSWLPVCFAPTHIAARIRGYFQWLLFTLLMFVFFSKVFVLSVILPNYVCIPGQFHPQFFGIEMEIVLTSCDRCGFPAVTWRRVHAPPRNTNFQSALRCPHDLILCYPGGKARVWVHVSVLLKHRVLHRRENHTWWEGMGPGMDNDQAYPDVTIPTIRGGGGTLEKADGPFAYFTRCQMPRKAQVVGCILFLSTLPGVSSCALLARC